MLKTNSPDIALYYLNALTSQGNWACKCQMHSSANGRLTMKQQ